MKQLLKLIKEHKILFIIWLILIITDISSMIEYGQDLDLQVLIYKIFIETSIIFGIGFILNSKLFSKTTDNNTNNANSFINNANNSVTNNLPNQNYVSENNNQMEKNNHKREYKIDNIIIAIGILLMVINIIIFIAIFIMFSLLQLFVDNKINWLKSLYTLLEHVPYLIVPFIIDGALIVLGIIIKIIKKLKK